MARTLPTTIVQAVNAQTTTAAFFTLLTLTHSVFSTVRIVNNTADITSNGNTFTAFPFSIILPADSEETQPRLRVTVSNVTRLLMTEIRTIVGKRERALVTISVVEAADPDTLLATWSDFVMSNVQYDAQTVQFDLAIENFLSEPFPALSFTPSGFPGLF